MYVDIRKVPPVSGDVFFVDTNVWYWATYIASKTFIVNRPKDYQVDTYPEFIESALNNGAKLYYSPLTLVELTGLIERSEFEIYKAYHGNPGFQFKRFRAMTKERQAVVDEVKTAWASIQGMANELPVKLECGMSENLITIIERHGVDGYDALYCHFMMENGISKIITDDKDFRNIDNLHLYSCYERG